MTHPRITLEKDRTSREPWKSPKIMGCRQAAQQGFPQWNTLRNQVNELAMGCPGGGSLRNKKFYQQKLYRISQQNRWFYGKDIWTWQSEWILMFWINSTNVKSWKHQTGFTIGYHIYDFASGPRNAGFLWRIQVWGKMREHKTPFSERHIIIKVEMRTVSEIMNEEVILSMYIYIYVYACNIYIYVCVILNVYI